ncbi:MAG TPA: hypothetical protein VNT75_07465, partial [Symbiobacteriaceae bacterium]|nr:hypothetical protein [Symbiobacteriaceae bacterium]
AVNLSFSIPVAVDLATLSRYLLVDTDRQAEISIALYESGSVVHLDFGQIKPLDRLSVVYAGPLAPGGPEGRFGFAISRRAPARVRAEMQTGSGPWQQLTGAAVVENGPLSLRFTMEGGPEAAAVRQKIAAGLGTAAGAVISQPSPEQFLVTIPQPPMRMDFEFDYVDRVSESGITVFTGKAPTLVAYNPATGKEEPVGTAPLDAIWAATSPDGRWALLWTTAPADVLHKQVWLVEVATGRLQLLPFQASTFEGGVFWTKNRLFLPGRLRLLAWDFEKGQGVELSVAAIEWLDPSPDGKYLAGYTAPSWGENGVTRATVVLVDTTALTWRKFPNVVSAHITGKEQYSRVFEGWSADSKTLVLDDRTNKGTTGGFVAIDAASGKVSAHPGPMPPSAPRPPKPVAGPNGWSFGDREWGTMVVYDPAGKERELGSGLALGWRPDGRLLLIRWSDEQYRNMPARPI